MVTSRMSLKERRKRRIRNVCVSLNCMGETHIIRIERGALIFENHKKCDLTHDCARVLYYWRLYMQRGHVPRYLCQLPQELKRAAEAALRRRAQRRKNRECNDTLQYPIRERILRRIVPLIEDAVNSCYRRSQSKVGGKHYVYVKAGTPHISGGSRYIWKNRRPSGTNSTINVTVDPVHWYMRIYRKNIPVVDGCFVLAHLGDDRYLVGRQSRGFDVRPWMARIEIGGDGKPHIVKWIRPAEIVLDENLKGDTT